MKQNKSWYSIQAKAEERTAKINIYEQIGESLWEGGVSARRFVAELDGLDVDSIDLHINSPGGNVFDGNAIYNALKGHKAKIAVTVDGLAASIASVIAMAGDTVAIAANGMMMIHDPAGLVMGNSKDMRRVADVLDKLKLGLVGSYMTRSKKPAPEIHQMMTDETWITADEAVEIGFADEVLRGVTAQNCAFDMFNSFKRLPESIRETMLNHAQKNEGGPKMDKMTMETLKKDYPEIVNALLDEGKAIGRQDGAKAERERIQAVRAQALPGHEQLIDDMANDGVTTGEQAAVRILQAEKQLRVHVQAGMAADAAALPHVPQAVAPDAAPQEDLTTEAGMQAKWQKDSDLRAEFGNDFEAYQAYQQATNRGLIRVLKK